MVDVGRVISTAIQFIDGFTRPSQAVINSMRSMGNEAIKVGKQIQDAGKTISNTGSAFAKSITLPIAGIAAAAIKMGNDFENAIAKVSTIADTTTTPMETLKQQVIDLSNIVGVEVYDIAEAQYQAISAGVDTASSVDFVSTAVKAAKGGFTDTTTAVNGLTTVLNSYKMGAEKATEVSDQMLIAQNYGKTSFGEMASSMGNVIPIASSLDVSTQELFSSIAVLTKNGIATSASITGLKAAFSNILKPSADAAKYAQSIGLEFNAAHLQSVGWAQMLQEIKEKTNGDTEAMGRLFGSTEALNSVLVLAGKGSEDFATAMGMMQDSAGATQAAYEKMLTPAERMNIAFNKIKNSLIQFGAALTPAFEKVADIIGKVGDRLNNLSEGQVNAIVKIAAIAAAIGPVLMVFGKMVITVGTVKRTYGTMLKTIANMGGIAKMIASPAGIVIGVLAAIAVAAVLIIKNWDQVKAFLSNVGAWFKNAFEKAGFSVEGFKNKFLSIGNTIGSIADKIGGFCKSIAAIFSIELGGSVSEGVATANDGLQGFVGGVISVFNGIVIAVDKGLKVFEALLDFLGGAFMGNWDSAVQGFRNSLKNIFPENIANGLIKTFDVVLPTIIAVIEGIKATFSGLIQDLKKIFDNIETIFGGIGTFFKGVFSGDIDTALEGFKTVADATVDIVGNVLKGAANAIKNFVTGALSTFLPDDIINNIAGAFDTIASTLDIAIGAAKGTIEGFIQAITPLINSIKTALQGVAQFLKGVFTGDWKSALNGLKTIASGALSGLANNIKIPFTIIKNLIKGAINSFKNLDIVKSIFTGLANTIKNALTKCGVDVDKFSAAINSIKTRVSSIINNLKTIFGIAFGTIGKVIRKAAEVVSNIFGKKINSTCSTSGAVLIAFKEVTSVVFKFIVNEIKKAMSIIVPVVKVAFGAIKGTISAAVNAITSVINGILTIFDGITTFISGVFTGNWKRAWEGVRTIFRGVFDSLAALCKAPINAVIGVINGAISGINKINISIPDWVPAIGGQNFGINIPTIQMLYKGTDNWQGGTAVIHDRGGEIVDLPKGSRVYPHDKSIEMARKEGAVAGGSNGISIVIQKLADKIEVRSDEDIDRIAEALALKIRKVALNTGTT